MSTWSRATPTASPRRSGPGPRSRRHGSVRQRPRPRTRDRAGRRRSGGRWRLAGGSHRPTECRAPGGLVTPGSTGRSGRGTRGEPVGHDRMRQSTSPVAGCAHTRPPPARRRRRSEGGARDLERQPELPVHERGRTRSRGDPGAGSSANGKVWPRRSPPKPRHSTPTSGGGSGNARRRAAPGLLHAAGYAREKHAVYVVCDGTCGEDVPALSRSDSGPGDRSAPRGDTCIGGALGDRGVGRGVRVRRSACPPRGAGFSLVEAMAMSVLVVRRRRPVRRRRLRRRPASRGRRSCCSPALLNARHLLYSAALAPWVRDVPRPPRAVDGPPPDR